MEKYIYRGKLDRVVDGDTIDAYIDVGFDIWLKKRVRFNGIDTWESRTRDLAEKAKGLEAKARLIELLDKVSAKPGYFRIRSFGLGKSAYEQAMETGALRLGQATTDIYQGLEQDVYGLRDAWKTGQRSNLNTILGMDIWGGGTGLPGGGSEQEEWEEQNQTTCCDGETVQMAALCGPGNMPGQCDDTGNDSGGNPPGDTNPCPDSDFSYQCPDGTCVNSQLECLG